MNPQISPKLEHRPWTILVNNEPGGELTDQQYDDLMREVNRDWRVWSAYGSSAITLLLKISATVVRDVPVIVFWLVVAVVCLDPVFAQATLVALTTKPAAVQELLQIATLICVFAIGLRAAFGRSMQIPDHHDNAIADSLRQWCNAPSNAQVRVVCEYWRRPKA